MVHQRMYADEKPLACDVMCDKSFAKICQLAIYRCIEAIIRQKPHELCDNITRYIANRK